jgi:hypothetical protein
MGSTGTAGRPDGKSAAVMIAVAGVLAAGCGTAAPASHAVRSRTSVTARTLVPPGGSPAEARAVGGRMLSSLILPPGAHRIAPRSEPPRSELIGGLNVVDVSRFYSLPVPEGAAFSFLQHHVPARTSLAGTGWGSGPGTYESVQYSLKAPPAGLEQFNMLLATLTAGPNDGTLLRADAELTWYPPRSAAEYIQPAAHRSVTVTVSFSSLSARAKARTITRFSASRAVIARLAGLLDVMHATAPWTGSCPANLPQFRILFAPKRNSHAPPVSVSPAGCRGETITADGKVQPDLEDVNSTRLLSVIGLLFGLNRHYW